MKQHAATWEADDFKPRKGPHRLARSSTRRRLFVEVPECIAVTPYNGVRLSVWVCGSEHGEAVEGGTYLTATIVDVRVYGPLGAVWGEVCSDSFSWWDLRCPSLEGRQAPSRPSPLLEAAGFRAVRRPLADLTRAEQALTR